jgi:hypothetical protein
MAGNFSVNTPLAVAIKDYTGLSVIALEVYHDPVVEGTWAVQATVANDANTPRETGTVQFLLTGFTTGVRSLLEVTDTDLEEVEFTAWPPTRATFHAAGGR